MSESKQIIEKAAELFLTFGPKAVTMDDISLKMGISKKTLYQFFQKKNELVEDVMLHVHEQIEKAVDEIQLTETKAINEMFQIHDTIFEMIRSENEIFVHQLIRFYPEIYNKHKEEKLTKMLYFLKKSYKKGEEQGVFKSNENNEITLRFLIANIMAIKNGEVFYGIDKTRKYLQKELLIYHLNAVVTDKGRQVLDNYLK